MKTTGVIIGLMSMALLMTVLFSIQVKADPTVVIDEVNITVDNESPAYNDTVTITAPVIIADADIVKVELIWMLCIEDQCYIPTTIQMTDDGSDNYVSTIGPFDERDGNGELYLDIGFRVKVTYTATGGGDELTTESADKEIYFDQTSATPVDADTDTDTDGEEEKDDSPLGMEIAILGIIIAIGIFAFKRKKN